MPPSGHRGPIWRHGRSPSSCVQPSASFGTRSGGLSASRPDLVRRGPDSLGYLVGLAGVVLAGPRRPPAGYRRAHTVEMLFLVPVVFVATRWGIRLAVVASLAALSIYDLLFVRQRWPAFHRLAARRAVDPAGAAVHRDGHRPAWRLGAARSRAGARGRGAAAVRRAEVGAVARRLARPAHAAGLDQGGRDRPAPPTGAQLDETTARAAERHRRGDRSADPLVANLLDLSRIEGRQPARSRRTGTTWAS